MFVKENNKEANFLRDLGNGLLMRRSTHEDADRLADFNARLHSDDGPDQPDERVEAWVSDLLSRPHPSFNVGDFTIVEEAETGKIVSSLNLISQTWSYAGIEFKVGRPELVGTDPEYRNRGLVRAQFDMVHRWSAERGELVQAITGIPYYYRLFGYEMAMNLGGGRLGFLPHIPKPREDGQEPFRLRPATPQDLEFISGLYNLGCRRSLVSCVWREQEWLYELNGKSEKNVNRAEVRVIETKRGRKVGYLTHGFFNWDRGASLVVTRYELKPGVSWAEVTPSVIRYLKATGEANASKEAKEPFGAFGFWLGESHPVYDVLRDRLPRKRKPYAWYLRVPDLPAFLRLITPVLEERLKASACSGHTGEVKITFYRSGLRIALQKGRLSKIEPWRPEPVGHAGDAAFPGLTFLQLVFGYRSFQELDDAFPDCWADNDEAFAILSALFPRQASDVWAVA
jgi:hypothetical protein